MKFNNADSSRSSEYYLGYFVGLHIIDQYLPTTSVDGIRTRNRISTSIAEFDKHKRLEDVWFKEKSKVSDEKDEENWGKLITYWKDLSRKYLPPILQCYIDKIEIRDKNEFKKGLIFSMWNCDCCHYSLKPENIQIKQDELSTLIEFILDV